MNQKRGVSPWRVRAAARCLLLVAAGVGAVAGPSARAQQQPPLEADEASVKAAFTINFAKFTEWPAARLEAGNGKFTLCLLGGSASLADALRSLEGRSVQQLRVTFRRLDSGLEAASCLVLFTAGSGTPPPLQPGAGVLTIGDEPGFVDQGGMIGFVRSGTRLRFEVNPGALQRAGLALSSQVLELATHIVTDAAPRGAPQR